MDIGSLEKLIDDVSNNVDVAALSEEIKKIISGTEPINNLLAFVPMVARVAYGIVEKDGTRSAEIENIVKIIISLLQNKMALGVK